MKIKKIIIAVLFGIFLLLGSNQHISIQAEDEIVEEDYEHIPEVKRSPVSENESSIIYEVDVYLKQKYGTNDWTKGKHNTTETISRGIPIEMQNTSQYDMIGRICEDPNMDLDSSYGGCGPIAMIGMADFFSRIYGYKEIINNPDNL